MVLEPLLRALLKQPSEPSTRRRTSLELDSLQELTENACMEILGRIHNGVVILEGNPALPEGAIVAVTYPVGEMPVTSGDKKRVEFPLVQSANPGSVHLTNERIHEILEEEDIEALKAQGSVPS